MSAPGNDKARDEARGGLAAADEDAASARVLIEVTPPRTATAAYLCQQAAEKLMKGLTCAAVPFRRTHNLDELAGQVDDTYPELRQLVAPLRWQTSWSFVFRYPRAERTAEPAPTVAELLAVLDDIARLLAELHARTC